MFLYQNADFSLRIHLLKMGNYLSGLNGLIGAFVQCKLIQQPKGKRRENTLLWDNHVILL